ncbi:MAG TPA: outer membrane protein transport protein [Acidobacteriota bacterium]|nr:outer membrane protein transport protein [Acidobacteriota bacterium]
MNERRPVSVLLACLILTALGSVSLAPSLAADDFAFHEVSARAASLGGAFTARADDASTLFYNPAGLAFLGGLRFKTNITLGGRRTDATGPGGAPFYRSNPFEILGATAISWQPIRRVTVSTGLFPVATFRSLWDSSWSGRGASLHTDLFSSSFRSTFAVEVVKDFAISAGVDLMKMNVIWNHELLFDLANAPLPQPFPVESRERLSGSGIGFVGGVLWKIAPAVQIGASYRSPVNIDLAGRFVFASFSLIDYRVPGPGGTMVYVSDLVNRFYENQSITGRLAVPRELTCGALLTPVRWLSLCADVQWTRWSEFGAWSFRSVNADGVLSPDWTPELEGFFGISPDYGTQGVPFVLEDTRKIKAGIECRPAEHLAVRVGYARTISTVGAADRTPVYPDLDRNIYTLGVAYEGPVFSIWRTEERIADLSFDAFARYAAAAPGESTFPGLEMTYSSKRFTWGVGVGFSF